MIPAWQVGTMGLGAVVGCYGETVMHEAGHVAVRRTIGLRRAVVRVGVRPFHLQWRCRGVVWRLGWIPFGAFRRGRTVGRFPSNRHHLAWLYGAGPVANLAVGALGLMLGAWLPLLAGGVIGVAGANIVAGLDGLVLCRQPPGRVSDAWGLWLSRHDGDLCPPYADRMQMGRARRHRAMFWRAVGVAGLMVVYALGGVAVIIRCGWG